MIPTGLLDKNGTEVYVGDIVRFYFKANDALGDLLDEALNDASPTEMIDVVECDEGTFFFTNTTTGDGAYAYRYNEICEVIGNIEENPELIGETNDKRNCRLYKK